MFAKKLFLKIGSLSFKKKIKNFLFLVFNLGDFKAKMGEQVFVVQVFDCG